MGHGSPRPGEQDVHNNNTIIAGRYIELGIELKVDNFLVSTVLFIQVMFFQHK